MQPDRYCLSGTRHHIAARPVASNRCIRPTHGDCLKGNDTRKRGPEHRVVEEVSVEGSALLGPGVEHIKKLEEHKRRERQGQRALLRAGMQPVVTGCSGSVPLALSKIRKRSIKHPASSSGSSVSRVSRSGICEKIDRLITTFIRLMPLCYACARCWTRRRPVWVAMPASCPPMRVW